MLLCQTFPAESAALSLTKPPSVCKHTSPSSISPMLLCAAFPSQYAPLSVTNPPSVCKHTSAGRPTCTYTPPPPLRGEEHPEQPMLFNSMLAKEIFRNNLNSSPGLPWPKEYEYLKYDSPSFHPYAKADRTTSTAGYVILLFYTPSTVPTQALNCTTLCKYGRRMRFV